MSANTLDAEGWLQLFRSALVEVAGPSLGELHDREPMDEPLRTGAYIPLVVAGGVVRVGVGSTARGCQELARTFLRLGEQDAISESDTTDALCELMNVVAGRLKYLAQEKAITMSLGLPMYAANPAERVDGFDTAYADVQIGSVPASLVLMRPRSGAR